MESIIVGKHFALRFRVTTRVRGCIADGCALQKKETEFNAASRFRRTDSLLSISLENRLISRIALQPRHASQFAILAGESDINKLIARGRIAKLASSRLGFRFPFSSLFFFSFLFRRRLRRLHFPRAFSLRDYPRNCGR